MVKGDGVKCIKCPEPIIRSFLFASCCVYCTVPTIMQQSTFHEHLSDDDLVGSKHVANVHNKQILIE
jgi:hypothetical protein